MMSGPIQPIEMVQLPLLRPGLAAALRPILEAHGATIEETTQQCVVCFPQGTTKQRKFPFVETDRYDIVFPDGYTLLYEVYRNGQTNLRFDPEDLPPAVRARFQ